MAPLLMPSMRSRPLWEELMVTRVPGQIRTSPPRLRRKLAGTCPAATEEPLRTWVPAPARITEPRTVASEANSSPTGAWARAIREMEAAASNASQNGRRGAECVIGDLKLRALKIMGIQKRIHRWKDNCHRWRLLL